MRSTHTRPLCIGLLLACTLSQAAYADNTDDVDIATYTITPTVSFLSDVRSRGTSDSLNSPGAKVGIEAAHQSGLVAIAEVNNVDRTEFTNAAGVDITLAGGWRIGNPDKWHFGIGLASEIFPNAKFQAPQSFDFVNGVPTNVTSTSYNTDYAVLEIGYGNVQGRIMNVISKTYRGANTGGVCGSMLQFSSDPTKALECYSRGQHGSRGTWLFDLDYKYAVRPDTTLDLHAGYQDVANFPEADAFDYSIGVTHTHWGFKWKIAWVGIREKTHELYIVQRGSNLKSIDKPAVVVSVSRQF